MDLQGQLGKMGRDIISGPSLFDMAEIAVVGGVLGAAFGYARDRNARGAKSFALWGVGLGVAGQYLLFHMLKPALRAHAPAGRGGIALQVAPKFASRGELVGNGSLPEAAGWGHGEMMGAVPYPHYAQYGVPGWAPRSETMWAWWE
jgi:hypothetical protein